MKAIAFKRNMVIGLIVLFAGVFGVPSTSGNTISSPQLDVTFGTTPTVDGIISAGEYTDANSLTFGTSGGTCTVYFKHDGTTLYVAFNVPNRDANSAVQIFLDTDHDQATLPQPDDYRLTIARRSPPNEYGENQGTGSNWTPWGPPVGWTGAHQDLASSWNAEFAIPYAKLGIVAGVAKTMGISFVNAWTSSGDHVWPTGQSWINPSTWGDASSSDNWAPPFEPFYFVHLTDTHYGYDGARARVNQLIDEILTWQPKPAFVIVTGDLLSWGWDSPGLPYVAWPLYEEENNDYSRFKTDFDRLSANGIPYFVCPGNHDWYDFPAIPVALGKFVTAFPNWSAPQTIRSSLYLIPINSSYDDLVAEPFFPPKGYGLGSDQINSMNSLLDDLDGLHNGSDLSSFKKVIMMHHPIINYLSYTHGDLCLCWTTPPYFKGCDRWDAGVIHNNRGAFKQLCDQYDVDLVCSGHTHPGDRTYDASMDGSTSICDQGGYDKDYDPQCYIPPEQRYPVSTADKTLYEYTDAACNGGYRICWVMSDRIMVSNANVLDGIIIASILGCPATLHLYDATGNHVGRNDVGGADFNIQNATYSLMPIGDTAVDPTMWEHTDEEISMLLSNDDFRYEIKGTGDGLVSFSVKKELSAGGGYARLFYDSLTVFATSIGKLYVHGTSLNDTIYMDDDGNGTIDRKIQPDVVIGMLRGDANGDGVIDVGDVVYLINYLFKGGSAPNPLETGDVNCDSVVDVGDVVYLINYLFKGGSAPGCK